MSLSCACYCCSTSSNCTVALIGTVIETSHCDFYQCHSTFQQDCPLSGGRVIATETPSSLPDAWIIIIVAISILFVFLVLFLIYYYTDIFQNYCCNCDYTLDTAKVYPITEFDPSKNDETRVNLQGCSDMTTIRDLESRHFMTNNEHREGFSESPLRTKSTLKVKYGLPEVQQVREVVVVSSIPNSPSHSRSGSRNLPPIAHPPNRLPGKW